MGGNESAQTLSRREEEEGKALLGTPKRKEIEAADRHGPVSHAFVIKYSESSQGVTQVFRCVYDVACEIVAALSSFPRPFLPFSFPKNRRIQK